MTTDEPDEQLDPASPEDDARIRGLLSSARVTEPMPTEVAARLDDVLAGLAAERGMVDPLPADNVVPITRTRRHRVVAVLGAAAAVVVLGLGFATFFNSAENGADDAASGDDAGFSERGAQEEDAADAAPESAAAPEDSLGNETGGGATNRDVYREGDRGFAVRSRQLSRDLARIQDQVLVVPADADYARGLVLSPQDFTCRLAGPSPGVLVAVRYDGRPAFVRFLEPMGESQVVEVLQCRSGDVLRSTTLPTDG
jgi:hypothetical protein